MYWRHNHYLRVFTYVISLIKLQQNKANIKLITGSHLQGNLSNVVNCLRKDKKMWRNEHKIPYLK